jgi:hypothetical protein
MRLDGNTYPISAMSDIHHRYSKQGVPTDSWKVCSGVKFDHDERMHVYDICM